MSASYGQRQRQSPEAKKWRRQTSNICETPAKVMHVAVSQPTPNGHLANQMLEKRRSDGKGEPSITIQNTDLRGQRGD
jgi:hypothetical protein